MLIPYDDGNDDNDDDNDQLIYLDVKKISMLISKETALTTYSGKHLRLYISINKRN